MRTFGILLSLPLLYCTMAPATAQLATIARTAMNSEEVLRSANSGGLTLHSGGFEENKGQVLTTSGMPAPFVRYHLSSGNTNIYLLDGGIAYQFHRVHVPDEFFTLQGRTHRTADEEARLAAMKAQAQLETYRMDVVLEGADPQAMITVDGRSADHTNYYNHDALEVHSFSTVIYHEVYPGIDWTVRSTGTGIEQDFIVRAGADPALIKLRFKHHEELRVDAQGRLIHGNRMGRFTEEHPVSYQNGRMIGTRFLLANDLLTFALDAYDRSQDLRIDPPRLWGTYYGGTGFDYSQGVALDGSGNVYLAGWAQSTSAIATPGAQQTSWQGEDDAMLVKFDADGVRQWGTYYGGTLGDAFASCAVSGSALYAAGITRSTSGVATQAHQVTLGGDWDGLLVKFNTGTGLREWASYYGGTAEDRVRGCATGPGDVVYITGFAMSTSGISSSESYQETFGGGSTGQSYSRGDAFLARFNSGGTRDWGTYYGGNSDDEGSGCATDGQGNVYMGGGTGSSNGTTIATEGSHQATFGAGGSDGFLVKFNSGGGRVWGTYYGGGASDYGFGCSTDPSGNVYLTGDTYSNSGIASGGHQNTFGGGALRDAFLVKFNTDGTRQWATYYGGTNEDTGRGCTTDTDGNAYLIGETVSTNAISFNGHQMSFGGGEVDGYLAAFTPAGVRTLGTYYGGSLRDEAYTAAVDESRNIYLCGRTLSSNAIGTAGAHQPVYGGVSDAYLVKFGDPIDCQGVPNGPAMPGTPCSDEDPCTTNETWSTECVCVGTAVPGPTMGTVTGNSPLCVGDVLNLQAAATGVGTINYLWTGPDGFGSGLQNPAINNVTVAAAGTYNVTASNGCGTNATGSVAIIVNPQPTTATVGGDQTICANGTSTGLGGNTPNVGSGSWSIISGGTGTFSPNNTTPNATFTHTGGAGPVVVRWTISLAPCVASWANVTLTINQPPTTASVGGPQTICAGGTTAGLGGNTPTIGTGSWSVVSGGAGTFNPNETTPNATFTPTQGSGPYVLRWTISNAPCTASTAEVTITVNQPPTTATVGGAQTICANGTSTGLGGNTPVIGSGAWSVASGGTGTFSNAASPNATFTHTGGAGPVVVRWTISNAPCAASTADVSITINQPPTTANTGGAQTICANGTTNGLGGNTPVTGTGVWSVVSGGTGTFSNAASPNATFTHTGGAGPVVVRWTISNAPCPASTADVSITINQPPTTATVGGPQTICANGTTSGLGGNTPTIGTGAWSVVSGGTGTFSNASSPNATFTHTGGAGPVIVSWTISNAPCTPSTANVTITVNPSPTTATTGGTQTICTGGTTAGLGGNTPLTGTGAWSIVSGGNGTFNPNAGTANATFTHSSGAGPIVLRWTISNAPCAPSTADVTVVINQPPTAASAGGPQTICASGTSSGLGGNTPGIGTGAWTVVSGGTGSFSNAASPNATFTHSSGAGPVIVRWTISNAPCTATSADVTLTISPAPTTATVGGPQTICANGTTTGLGGNTPTNGTGAWSVVSGGTGTFSNASSPNATFTHTGGAGPVVVRWTISNAPCTASTANVTITINQPPTAASTGGAQTICAGGTTAGLGGNTPTIGTGSWSVVSGGTGTFSNAASPGSTFTHTGGTGPVIVRWTISNAPCTASTADASITINQAPTTATVGGPQTICATGTTSGLGGNTPTVGTGAWSVVSGGTGTFSNAASPGSTFTHTGGTGPVVVRWTISNAPCTASSANVTLTINQPPTTATVGGPKTICANGTTTGLGGNTPLTGTGSWSVVSGGTGTFSNASSPNATFTHTGGAGPVIVRWTISNAPCTASSANVTVTISPDTDGDGLCDVADNCPNVAGQIGSACNDGNALTINDVLNANCICQGTPVNCVNAGDCDDEDPCTLDDCVNNACVYTPITTDTDGDGIPNCADDCPNVAGEPGSACNDNDACTINDVLNATCACVGTFSGDTDADGICNATDDCPTVPGEIGSACNDNDPCTLNDVLNNACVCTGTFSGDTDADGICNATDDCPTVPGEIGSPCNDGNNCTVNDALNASCDCVGTFDNSDTDGDGIPNCDDNCPTVPGEIGDPCNDGDPCTINDVIDPACQCTGTNTGDTDGDGICDELDDCPTVAGEVGDACDDGDPCTIDDVINALCACEGTDTGDTDGDGVCDELDSCPTVPGQVGDPCDDGDDCTINDALTSGCLCAGTPDNTDSDGDAVPDCADDCPNVSGQVGSDCDDGNNCTVNDALNANCGCVGTVDNTDSDGDGIPNCTDLCDDLPGQPGDACDDDDPLTIDDQIVSACVCVGTPVSCTVNGDCDDFDPCTVDVCDNNACTYTPLLTDSDGDGVPDCADDCPAVVGQQGSDCDDGDLCTIGDVLDANCECTGTPDNTDTDGDGIPNCADSCPTTPGQVGSACDDNDPLTISDELDELCVCTGIAVNCVVDGDCNDNDACTSDACVNNACVFTPLTADQDEDLIPDCIDLCPTVFGEPGSACDDGNICTINDVLNASCGCAGAPDNTDTDGDGILDCEDECPDIDGEIGDGCDDGQACTVSDAINAQCQCAGTPAVVGPIDGPLTISGFTDQNYTVPTIPGATYVWILPDLWISSNTTSAGLAVFAQQGPDTVDLCVNAYLTGCSDLEQACISIIVLESVGLEEQAAGDGPWLAIQPNPSRGLFELVRTDMAQDRLQLTIADATGRIIASPAMPAGQKRNWLDLRDVAPGIYYLRVGAEERMQVVRLLIER